MTASFAMFSDLLRRPAAAAIAAALMLPALSGPGQARGPEKIADVAETVIDAVVNISTSQRAEATNRPGQRQRPGQDRPGQDRPGQDQAPGQNPQVPPGSPFEDF